MNTAAASAAQPSHLLESRSAAFLRNSIFYGFHATVLLAFWSGVSWWALGLCVFMYYARMFGITAGYHRYFAHKSFRTSRVVQFLLALLGALALQKGVLWWAGHHRDHHKFSDQPQDVHSPKDGFFWSHMGWIAHVEHDYTPWRNIPDLAKYPELRFLNSFWVLPFIALCVTFHFTLGFQALVWGCFVSTVLLWHGTFSINSLAHIVGRRVYATEDTSKNSFALALLTMGEGWHNNHHYYQAAAHQGFRWWELDATYYLLCGLEKLGIIWDVRRASPAVIDGRLGKKDYLLERLEAADEPEAPLPAAPDPAASAPADVAAAA